MTRIVAKVAAICFTLARGGAVPRREGRRDSRDRRVRQARHLNGESRRRAVDDALPAAEAHRPDVARARAMCSRYVRTAIAHTFNRSSADAPCPDTDAPSISLRARLRGNLGLRVRDRSSTQVTIGHRDET